ncbi:MAG: PLP-dependent aspartate aminotransferase family protein [Parachlamydiales bacterium]|jgi:cystathionine beta-lyase/cystathionine gamma-synthase
MRFSTKALHAGENRHLQQSSVMPPIFMTSTFVQDIPGEGEYEYTRAGNPNFTILEDTLAALEDAQYATVFSSGLGALTGLLSSFSAGDKIVALEGLYGGTYRLFNQVFKNFNIRLELVSVHDLRHLKEALSGAKLFCFETPTNPLLEIYDIQALSTIAHAADVPVLIDNTFATPYLQNPLLLGADIVWHSTTKYIGGHSDTIGGAMMTNDETIKTHLDFGRKALGVNPSPFDCWLITRGVKTLALRMEQHQKNAGRIANYFQQQPFVKKVYYPGLPMHPGHALAAKQMRGFGGMLSVDLDLPVTELKTWLASLSYVRLAESLGGVESLICHPASMTHASIPKDERLKQGVSETLVRISVGLEDIEDLIEDFTASFQALQVCAK